MPLYARCVSPVYLSNAPLKPNVEDEREAIINTTLSGVLRQLASLVLQAEDIFHDLHKDFETIYSRAKALQTRVKEVQEKTNRLDAKAVIVPESDLTAFSELQRHHSTDYGQDRLLFTVDSRPAVIERLYQQAVQNPVLVLRQLDLFRSDGLRSSKFFTCTPTSQRERLPLDIETRRPEAVGRLPNWAADEAELTSPVHPDLRFHPLGQTVSEGALYQLPRPDQVTEARAQHFTAEVVAVDVTGNGFQRLIKFRQSLVHFDYVKRRRKRRDRNRRNTIGGTSEVREAALAADQPSTSGTLDGRSTAAGTAGPEQLERDDRQTQTETEVELSTAEDDQEPSFTTHTIRADIERAMADGGASVGRLPQLGAANTFDPPVREPVYELIRSARARLPLAAGPAAAVRRRAAASEASSSGHGSGGSNRTSADSERVVSPADSGTVTSPADEAPASPRRRLASPVDSGLSDGGRLEEVSFASDDTITPDFPDAEDADLDGDASSAFSCDTEGYYTSFHCDSGLRSAHESEYDLVGRGSTGTGTASNTSGSDSTVVLRRKPPPPPRASSLDASNRESVAGNRESVVTVINVDAASTSGSGAEKRQDASDPAPDDALHDNAKREASVEAAPTEPLSEAAAAAARQSSCSPTESDLDLPERQQDFRSKTAMTSGRIPSLCVITPPPSDGDDASLEWPAPASPVRALQVVTGRGPGGATVLVQPPPLEPPPPPAHVPGRSRGRSLSPHSSQTAPRPAPRPPPRGTGSLDRSVAARYANTAAAIYSSLRRAGRRQPAADPLTEPGPGPGRSPPSSPLPSPPPDPRRREPRTAEAGGGEPEQDLAGDLPLSPRQHKSPDVELGGKPAPGRTDGRLRLEQSSEGGGVPASLPNESAVKREETSQEVKCADVRLGYNQHGQDHTDGKSASHQRQQEAGLGCQTVGLEEAQQLRRHRSVSPSRRAEQQRSPPVAPPGGQYRQRSPLGQPALLQQQQQLLPPNLRSPTLGQPGYMPSRLLQPRDWRAASPPDQTSYRQPQQQQVHRQSQQQLPYQQQQQQQQQRAPSGIPISPIRQPGFQPPAGRAASGSYRPQSAEPPHPASSTPRNCAPQGDIQLVGSGPRSLSGIPETRRFSPLRSDVRGDQRSSNESSSTDSSHCDEVARSADPQSPIAQPQSPSRRAADALAGGKPAAGRVRKPTPAAGAIATPPAGHSSPTVQSLGRSRRPPDAAASCADAGKTKSRLPRAFSPFSFGRASLRAKSPSAAKEKEERRLASQSVSEAEEEPRTDEQKLKRLKKKWLWTLPLKRRVKKKTEGEGADGSDDEGGFRAGAGSSFVRYESPDSVSSGVSSRASTPLTDASMSSSYYEMEQYFPALNTSQGSATGVSSQSGQSDDSGAPTRPDGETALQMAAPRPPNFSNNFMEYSPPDNAVVQSAAYATPPVRTNLVPKPPRAEAGSWPRAIPVSPQYAAAARATIADTAETAAGDAIYGTRTVFARPQPLPVSVAARAPAPPSVVRTGPAGAAAARSRRSWSGAPPALSPGLSPGARPSDAAGQRASWAGRTGTPTSMSLAPLTRPTSLTEFKQLVARQSSSPGGSAKARLSAADRLRPAAVATSTAARAAPPSPLGPPQSPLDARNSARAMLFQNRFGGRRCRTPRTNVMATTIPESEEEPLPPARRQLFAEEGSSAGESASSGSSGSSPEAPLRMSPSSPPPPYSAGSGFTPVGDARPRRAHSLPAGGTVQRPTPRPPGGERQKFQCGSLPRGPLAATFSYSRPGERPPFRRACSLTADRGRAWGPPPVTAGPSADRPASAGRVETAL